MQFGYRWKLLKAIFSHQNIKTYCVKLPMKISFFEYGVNRSGMRSIWTPKRTLVGSDAKKVSLVVRFIPQNLRWFAESSGEQCSKIFSVQAPWVISRKYNFPFRTDLLAAE